MLKLIALNPATCLSIQSLMYSFVYLHALYFILFRGLVCICHGVHEHMGRYEKLAEHLKSSGLLVFGIDLGNINRESESEKER